MSHYTALLRSYHAKATKSGTNGPVNNENDENSTIKNLILKHVSKGQQACTNEQGTIRGILGEVGNMNLTNKPLISKPKIVQQQNSIETLIEYQSTVAIPPPAPPPLVTTTITLAHQIEDIVLDDDSEMITDVPAEFDCDSADLYNITTASEYVLDICKYWRELEQRTPIRPNFLLHRTEGLISSFVGLGRQWILL
jgi:hypothetical protein